jgi:hypothetical protein
MHTHTHTHTHTKKNTGLHAYKFYLKTKEDGHFHVVSLEMRTTGGDCRNLVQKSLETFFTDCGLESKFVWGEGDWQYAIERMTEEEREEVERREREGY